LYQKVTGNPNKSAEALIFVPTSTKNEESRLSNPGFFVLRVMLDSRIVFDYRKNLSKRLSLQPISYNE